MPITKQAIKRDRQNSIRRERNLQTMSMWQKLFKKVRKAVAGGDAALASELLPSTYKAVDTAAKKQVISASKAARKKAQAASLVKSVGGSMQVKKEAKKDSTPKAKKAAPKKTTKAAPAKKTA